MTTVNEERFAGLQFSWFLSLLRKFSYEFLSNKHWWPMHCESISTKNFIGLKPQMFSPVNLSPFMVYCMEFFLYAPQIWEVIKKSGMDFALDILLLWIELWTWWVSIEKYELMHLLMHDIMFTCIMWLLQVIAQGWIQDGAFGANAHPLSETWQKFKSNLMWPTAIFALGCYHFHYKRPTRSTYTSDVNHVAILCRFFS